MPPTCTWHEAHLSDARFRSRDAEQAFCFHPFGIQVSDGFGDDVGYLWLCRDQGHPTLALRGGVGGADVEGLQEHGGGVELAVVSKGGL